MRVGLILAGGLSRRMGGEPKAFMVLAGKPLIQHAIDRLAPQVDRLVLNVNQHQERFEAFGLPMVGDQIDGFAGPLAGIDAGLAWIDDQSLIVDGMICAACDAPFFPLDLADRLITAEAPSGVAFAASGGRSHPVFSAWSPRLRQPLREALQGGLRKVDAFPPAAEARWIEWPDHPFDPFFNINRPEDLQKAEALAHQALN